MSLVMVSWAVADFVESAWLVAVTWTIAGEGRSPGVVYMPADVIVPLDALPLATPFTLQITLVSVAFVTVAVNVCEFPSRTDPLVGVTVTPMDGRGGGGGGATDSGPPPQPTSQVPAVRTRTNSNKLSARAEFTGLLIPLTFMLFCVRGRMHGEMQAKGQRKEKSSFSRARQDQTRECLSITN
jgi:hypothetical protein